MRSHGSDGAGEHDVRADDAGDGQAARGGTYRVDWESSFDFTSDFDPTGEYSVQAFGLYSNLLVRTLVGYNHVAGPAGNLIVPDLATSTGTIGNGGRTYTFRLKDGIRFGPPLNREITSKDVAFAFERIATKSVGAQYGFYYDVIKGMAAYSQGEAKTITGIKTPNPRTVVFDLDGPDGRLPLPPRDAGGGPDAARGRRLLHEGRSVRPLPDLLRAVHARGLRQAERRELRDGQGVRSDLRLRRRAHARPRAESRLRGRRRTARGRARTSPTGSSSTSTRTPTTSTRASRAGTSRTRSPRSRRRSCAATSGSPQLHTNASDFTGYLTMNLTQRPFDDVHVRRAVNFVVDRNALRKARGGVSAGSIATHIAPNGMLLDKLKGYAPYGAYGRGDVGNARAEMKLSRYDRNHDGVCDAKVWGRLHRRGSQSRRAGDAPHARGEPEVDRDHAEDARRQGREHAARDSEPERRLLDAPRLGQGLRGRADVLQPALRRPHRSTRRATRTTRSSDSHRRRPRRLGVKGAIVRVPSVDADLDRCGALVGNPRVSCYAALDRKLTTKIVPWVPYLWASTHNVTSKNVTKWGFDQFGASIAYAHVAVNRPRYQRACTDGRISSS